MKTKEGWPLRIKSPLLRRVASLSAWSAIQFRPRRMWKKLTFLKDDRRLWILLDSCRDLKFEGGFRVIKVWIIILESPKTVRSVIPIYRAWYKPYQRPRASTMLLVSLPIPQEYLRTWFSSGSTITPPPPAAPRFPLEDPSKNKVCCFKGLFHLESSRESIRISHDSNLTTAGVLGMFWSNVFIQLNSEEERGDLLTKLLWDFKQSSRRVVALMATWGAGECNSGKIRLFHSSHSFQRINLGRINQENLSRALLRTGKGKSDSQLQSKECRSGGRTTTFDQGEIAKFQTSLA